MKTSTRREAPSTNLQAPEKFQTSNVNGIRAFLDWILVIEVSLSVGAWNLELSSMRFYKTVTTLPDGICKVRL